MSGSWGDKGVLAGGLGSAAATAGVDVVSDGVASVVACDGVASVAARGGDGARRSTRSWRVTSGAPG